MKGLRLIKFSRWQQSNSLSTPFTLRLESLNFSSSTTRSLLPSAMVIYHFAQISKMLILKLEIMEKLKKCQIVKQKIDEDAIKFSQHMHTGAMIGMSVLWGIMARLTWWEYSWDVIEPVTFFVTYGGAICCYTFYLATKTLPEYDDV